MEISLQLHIFGGKNTLRLKGVSEETGSKIVESFFRASGFGVVEKLDFEPFEGLPFVTPDEERQATQVVIENLEGFKSDFPNPHAVTLEPNPKVKTREAESVDEPSHWVTGIKIDSDGKERYKCRYWCECGDEGNHYIPVGTVDVKCRTCGYHIDVEPAGKVDSSGIPKRDNRGNFFVARAGGKWRR